MPAISDPAAQIFFAVLLPNPHHLIPKPTSTGPVVFFFTRPFLLHQTGLSLCVLRSTRRDTLPSASFFSPSPRRWFVARRCLRRLRLPLPSAGFPLLERPFVRLRLDLFHRAAIEFLSLSVVALCSLPEPTTTRLRQRSLPPTGQNSSLSPRVSAALRQPSQHLAPRPIPI